jgi:hypothetical protein
LFVGLVDLIISVRIQRFVEENEIYAEKDAEKDEEESSSSENSEEFFDFHTEANITVGMVKSRAK